MANNQINQFLEFANMQMAAEAFLLREGESGIGSVSAEQLIARLELGNTHASHFTPVQADQLTQDYRVLTHFRYDPLKPGETGFSATLFQKINSEVMTVGSKNALNSPLIMQNGKIKAAERRLL